VPAGQDGIGPAGHHGVGLAAARRAIRADGIAGPVHDPLVVEVVPPANMAVGSVPWGLGAWVPQPSLRRISTAAAPDGTADGAAGGTAVGGAAGGTAAGAPAAAAGRSLVIVVRDAHLYPAARDVVRSCWRRARMRSSSKWACPVWRPPAGGYVATYGAARTSGQAAAEVLGFACR
jgi:beta-N-acetylhexosaminidase